MPDIKNTNTCMGYILLKKLYFAWRKGNWQFFPRLTFLFESASIQSSTMLTTKYFLIHINIHNLSLKPVCMRLSPRLFVLYSIKPHFSQFTHTAVLDCPTIWVCLFFTMVSSGSEESVYVYRMFTKTASRELLM